MRVNMLTEARDEYYSLEMARASYRLVHDVLELKPGMNVVITADSKSDMRVVGPMPRRCMLLEASRL